MNKTAQASRARGAYPVAEAARLSHLSPRTVRRWAGGYEYRHKGELRRSRPVAYLSVPALQFPKSGGRGPATSVVLDFEQLLTLMLVRAFIRRGLGLPKIKKAAARAREYYGLDSPFASSQFRTDGNRIFLELDVATKGKDRGLIDVLSDQRQFREFVEPSLFRDVVFVGDHAGEWWPLGKGRTVLLAPNRQFGAPHLAGTGVRTDVVAQMVAAERGGHDGLAAAAEWFGLTPGQVADAVDFEDRWLSEPLD